MLTLRRTRSLAPDPVRVLRLEEANRHLFAELYCARRRGAALLAIGVLEAITIVILAAALLQFGS